MFRRPAALFRTLAIAEAISWTLLIGGIALRAMTGEPRGVSIGGAVHGFVFLSYGAVVILVAMNQRWGVGRFAVALLSAVIPYASVPAEVRLQRSGALEGDWRTSAGTGPRDATWHDRALRAVLRHPVRSGIGAVLAVAVVFTALLLIGPPGGR